METKTSNQTFMTVGAGTVTEEEMGGQGSTIADHRDQPGVLERHQRELSPVNCNINRTIMKSLIEKKMSKNKHYYELKVLQLHSNTRMRDMMTGGNQNAMQSPVNAEKPDF
jgi:hypothetical protein